MVFKGINSKPMLAFHRVSVLSPTLFNVYIKDIFEAVKSQRGKFADDGTIWDTGDDVASITDHVLKDLSETINWCNKWRMKLSIPKTEITQFSRAKQVKVLPPLQINNTCLKYNKHPRSLGIHLDEKLDFKHHISKTQDKALRALKVIREVRAISNASSKTLLKLYTTLIRPIMEYGSCVWSAIADIAPLEKVQRKALALCLGLPLTAGREAMEVATATLPLDLRFEEIAIRDVAKIMAKDVDRPIKKQLVKSMDNDQGMTKYTVTGPFDKTLKLLKKMEAVTKISIQTIEPECKFTPGCLQRSRTKPDYWSRLGSSKNRSTAQQQLGQEIIEQLMIDAPQDLTIFAFTDGSCLPNPGPCGAGAAILMPGSEETIQIKRPVSPHGSILLGELVAILEVMEYALAHVGDITASRLMIFSDSQSAVGLITLNWKPTCYQSIIEDIMAKMEQVRNDGVETEIIWTPGHADIKGNEMADQLANEAAKEASLMPPESANATQQDVKIGAREFVNQKWQKRWEITNTGRHLFNFKPQVTGKTLLDQPTVTAFRALTQLRTGYSCLNEYRYKTNQHITSHCQCGEPETVEHYLCSCPLQEKHRRQLRKTLSEELGLRVLDAQTLLEFEDDEDNKGWRETIVRELGTYIALTNRFQRAK